MRTFSCSMHILIIVFIIKLFQSNQESPRTTQTGPAPMHVPLYEWILPGGHVSGNGSSWAQWTHWQGTIKWNHVYKRAKEWNFIVELLASFSRINLHPDTCMFTLLRDKDVIIQLWILFHFEELNTCMCTFEVAYYAFQMD